jgi:hypothetical protein
MNVRRGLTLAQAGREFLRHPSPWMLAGALAAALGTRVAVGDWQLTDLVLPVVVLAVFPFAEWVIHVVILHWRPRRIAGVTVDPLLSRKHRAHHVEPRDLPLVFIPWQSLLWILPLAVATALTAFPSLGRGLTFLVFLTVLGIGYEWCHYLIHTDYKPKTAVYRSIWLNHRRHHFKNEHYWFTVTSSGTADRVLGTEPQACTMIGSPMLTLL